LRAAEKNFELFVLNFSFETFSISIATTTAPKSYLAATLKNLFLTRY
jgi:hypothetical protein